MIATIGLPSPVSAPGDRLAWEFKLEDKGLEVSAWVTPEAGPPVTLLPAKKYKAEDGAVTGSAVVPVAVRALVAAACCGSAVAASTRVCLCFVRVLTCGC